MTQFQLPTADLPTADLPWPIPYRAVSLIAQREGLYLTAYKCPAGVWTIGYGETTNVYPGLNISYSEACQRLLSSLTEFTQQVLGLCTRTPNSNQLGALVSLAYNVGIGALARSTVLRQFNAGNDSAAARAFLLFNNYRNPKTKQLEELAGLTARRAAESALFLEIPADHDVPPTILPQAVAAESSLVTSPIAQSSAVTATAGTVTIISSLSDNASTVSDRASAISSAATAIHDAVSAISTALNISPPMLLGITLVAAGAIALYWRYKQRLGGHA